MIRMLVDLKKAPPSQRTPALSVEHSKADD